MSTGATYQQAKLANAIIKAQKAKAQRQSLQDSLIDHDKALNHLMSLSKSDRELWLVWAEDVAETLAKAVGADVLVMHTLLRDGVRQQLTDVEGSTFRIR
jgi:hypothetical protein